jgi:hypothetical protein
MGEVVLPILRQAFILVCLTVVGCADGPCRQLRKPDLADQAVALPAGKPDGKQTGQSGVSTQEKNLLSQGTFNSTLLVYKPDGSLQCGVAKGMGYDEMEKKDLGGIKVFSRDKRSDGLMHIQVCGSPTGMINVFEVSLGQWPDAEKRGFRKLDGR